MNRFKLFFVGLMALIMTGLTSCLPGNDSDGSQTVYMSGYFSVSQNGKVLTTDDGHPFSVSNSSYLQYKDGTTPARVMANVEIVIPEGQDIDDIYKTDYYSVEIMDAYPCYMSRFYISGEGLESTARFTAFKPSAGDGYLNALVETVLPDNPTGNDFAAYVEKAENNTLYIKVLNVCDPSKASLTRKAVSFPLTSVIRMYEDKLTAEVVDKNYPDLKAYKLRVNDEEIYYFVNVKK